MEIAVESKDPKHLTDLPLAEVEATSLRVEGKNRKGVLYEEGADKTFFFRADNGALVGYRVKFGDNSIRATAIQLYIPKSVLELLGLTSL